MYRTIKKVLIAVWLLLVVTNVWAQLYPIQVNLTAPGSLPGSIHSLYEANGLKGSIVLLDRYQPTLEVGIGVRIKGNNATIERRSDYLGDPLMLHYGTPVMLGEQVFAPIFQDGITYNGANRDEFERRGALSPGSYEILVWAYDPTRPQVRISNEARCIVWVQQSAPPTLIQPQPNAVVYALPQFFSWTVAQNFPGLNPTKYRFLLYELQDLNRAPESEVLSSEPLYEQELLMPTFAYSTMNAQLTRGKRYAWRIQALAQDMNGREVSLFSNNGFSPVRTFTYGQDAVEYLKKTFEVEPRVSSPYAAEVTWKNVSSLDAPDGMKVEYRKTGASEWQSIEADDEMLTLSQLTPDTEYDIRGIARTGAEYGEAGPVVKFRTQKIPEAKCGPTESYKPDPNSPKLASLVVGDIFTANRTPFVVEEAKGDGTFTGKATSAIPFFGGRKIMFKFSGIALNQKYELLSGSLVADTVGIEKFISKSLQEQNQKLANTLEKKGDLLASEDTKKIDGEIKDATSIKVDTANKQITVTLADGQETIVPFEGKPIIIADSGGKVYSVSDAGAVTSLGMYDGKAAGGATGSGGGVPSAKPQVLSGADLLVAFEAATNQRYGFDDPNGLGGQVWKEKYDEITVGGSKKMVPAKMVAAGSTDVVSVSLKGDAASSDLKDLSFVTSTGMRYTASPSTQKDRLDLTVMGGADASRQELTAWMKKGDSTYAVGRLSIDAYAKKSLRVVLVPVGDVGSAHTAQVATEVARIYRQAGVEVSVTDVPKLPMPEGVSDALKVDKSLMSCYSAGMRSIRSAFTKSETYRKLGTSNVYYLFLVSLPMNGEDENAPFDGYMPYGKPFGFVRSAGMGAPELAWSIAHELGHGAFQLQHVWKEQGYTTDTRNLMGYSKTGELFRWQWQDIHHPVSHSNLLADEEDLGAWDLGISDKIISHIIQEMVIYRQNGINKISPFIGFDESLNFKRIQWFESSNIIISHEAKNTKRELEGNVSIQRLGSVTNSCDLSSFTAEKDAKGKWVLTFGNCMKIYIENEKTYTIINALLKLPKKSGTKSGKIIFVNGHYNSVASFAGLSPATGYKYYWANDYEEKAKIYFKENSNFNLYVDGTTALGGTESGSKRKQRGYNWAKENTDLLLSNMDEDGTFKLVGHSEGAAFAAGIAEYLKKEKRKKVDEILYLSPDEGDEFISPEGIPAYQLLYASYKMIPVNSHYPNDPMVGYHMIKNATLCGSVLRNDLGINYVHSSTAIESKVFEELLDLKRYIIIRNLGNNKNFYKLDYNVKTVFLQVNGVKIMQ